jgi:transcriptional regulator with XRE-family HTH domain
MLLANRIRVIRAERRVSQLRTALSSGVHPTRFWRIENGLVQPTEAERVAIARTLGVAETDVWLASVSAAAATLHASATVTGDAL